MCHNTALRADKCPMLGLMGKHYLGGAAYQVSCDPYEGAHYMSRHKWGVGVLLAVGLVGLIGCNQDSPTGKATEAAGQAAVDAIKVPIDKARGVEGTLEKSAEQTADKVKEAGQ